MKEVEEKVCPKCKEGVFSRYGIFRNEVTLNVNEDDVPEFFDDEVSEFRAIRFPEEVFLQCMDCEYKEKINGDEKCMKVKENLE